MLWANPWIALIVGALFGGFLVSGGNDTSPDAPAQNLPPDNDSAGVTPPEPPEPRDNARP